MPILTRICKKMQENLKFIPINVSSDEIIVDGHHRYLGSVITGYNLETVQNYPKSRDLNDYNWNSVSYVSDDWDTASKIKMLNQKDAQYNNMSLKDVELILK